MRDCVLKLKEDHPLKLWLKWVSAIPELSAKNQERDKFLRDIVNSQFNLITDFKIKSQIIEMIVRVPEKTMYEQLLKAQLYLIIGNVTKSDNILKSVIKAPPLSHWKNFSPRNSFYHKLAKEHFKQIMERLGRHPADRKNFELLCLYLKNYYNDQLLNDYLSDFEIDALAKRMDLKFIESLAPDFVHFLRLKRLEPHEQASRLRSHDVFPIEMQMYWVWPFLAVEPLPTQNLIVELQELHEKDLLWFLYLMDDEKLADIYTTKTKKSFVAGRRHYLRAQLDNDRNYMMSLYKLLELGDVDGELVRKTVHFLRHE